jgi:hypothetical protein
MHFDVVGAVRKPLGIPSKIESPEKIYKITEYFGAMNLKCLPKFTIAPNIRSFTDERVGSLSGSSPAISCYEIEGVVG